MDSITTMWLLEWADLPSDAGARDEIELLPWLYCSTLSITNFLHDVFQNENCRKTPNVAIYGYRAFRYIFFGTESGPIHLLTALSTASGPLPV